MVNRPYGKVGDYMEEQEFVDIVAGNLQSLIDEYGYTQTELAQDAGLSIATINNILSGKRTMSAITLVNLCVAIGCNFNDIVPDYAIVERVRCD